MDHAALLRRAESIRGLVLDVDGVLTDGRLYYGAQGEMMKSFDVRDGLGLSFLRDGGIRLAIVSGRSSAAVQARATELGADPVILGRLDKGQALQEVLRIWRVEPAELAAVGDDLVDLPILLRVGLSAAPADADERVRERVDWVLPAPGGRGAVRQLCELLLRAHGRWEALARRFELASAPEEPHG